MPLCCQPRNDCEQSYANLCRELSVPFVKSRQTFQNKADRHHIKTQLRRQRDVETTNNDNNKRRPWQIARVCYSSRHKSAKQKKKPPQTNTHREKERERDGENGSSPVSLEPFLAYYILCKERQCVAPEWRSGEKRGCCVFFHRPSIELEMEG
jgi:hypothetical protein